MILVSASSLLHLLFPAASSLHHRITAFLPASSLPHHPDVVSSPPYNSQIPPQHVKGTCRSFQMDIILQRQPRHPSNHHLTGAPPSPPDAGLVSPLQTPSRLIHSGAANANSSLQMPSPSSKYWLLDGANRAGHRCTMQLWHTL